MEIIVLVIEVVQHLQQVAESDIFEIEKTFVTFTKCSEEMLVTVENHAVGKIDLLEADRLHYHRITQVMQTIKKIHVLEVQQVRWVMLIL